MDPHMLRLSEGDCEELLLLLRWKDVVAMSVRTDSTATILLLLNGNSGNVASCFRDIKVCDSLISDVHHKLHLLSIKGSADTVCRMAVHASRCPGNELQSLPHVRRLFSFCYPRDPFAVAMGSCPMSLSGIWPFSCHAVQFSSESAPCTLAVLLLSPLVNSHFPSTPLPAPQSLSKFFFVICLLLGSCALFVLILTYDFDIVGGDSNKTLDL